MLIPLILAAPLVAGTPASSLRVADAADDRVAEMFPVSKKDRGHENTEWSTAYGFDLCSHGGRPRVLPAGAPVTRRRHCAHGGLQKYVGISPATLLMAGSLTAGSPLREHGHRTDADLPLPPHFLDVIGRDENEFTYSA